MVHTRLIETAAVLQNRNPQVGFSKHGGVVLNGRIEHSEDQRIKDSAGGMHQIDMKLSEAEI